MQTTDPSNFWRAESELAHEHARRQKSERTKDLGSPITIPGKPLAILVRENQVWIAESDAVARRVDLESGKTVQIYKGHSGPVTCIELIPNTLCPNQPVLLATGSWDKTIKLWDTRDKSLVSTTPAHSDFVKSLLGVPKLKLLISSGSDKIVRLWDLSNPMENKPLPLLGVLSSHIRPVQCFAVEVSAESTARLYTADSLGSIKAWDLDRRYGDTPHCRGIETGELNDHRTGINDMWYGNGQLWTASSDDTALLQYHPPLTMSPKAVPPFAHSTAVKALLPLLLTDLAEPYLITASGDLIRVYDVTSPEEPEIIQEVDAHWHDITALRLWMRIFHGADGKRRLEPWVVSSSLDGTIRKWRLQDLLHPQESHANPPVSPPKQTKTREFEMTEDEERELAELMDSD